MSQTDIDNALGAWVTASGFQPVVAYEDGKQASYPYVEIFVKDKVTTSNQSEMVTKSDGSLVYRDQQIMHVMLSAYKKTGASAMLESMLLEAASLTRRAAFLTAGMALTKREKIHRMPFREGAEWIDRAIVEVQFATSVQVVDAQSTSPGLAIAKVKVDPDILNGPDHAPFDVPDT